jgi:hypothetical protein
MMLHLFTSVCFHLSLAVHICSLGSQNAKNACFAGGKQSHVHIIDGVFRQFVYSGEQMCIEVSSDALVKLIL